MNKSVEMIDALGMPIRIDELYGYTTHHNGILGICIGRAERTTTQRVTLRLASEETVIGSATVRYNSKPCSTASVSPRKLFRVDEDELNVARLRRAADLD